MIETYAIQFTPTLSIALEVLCNLYGTGDERIRRLKEEGYDPQKVQNCVNDLLKLMEKYQ